MTDKTENRREFLKQSSFLALGLYLGSPSVSRGGKSILNSAQPDPLLDWSDWEKYRTTVSHPCLAIKQENLDFAKENIEKYDWAKAHFNRIHDIIKNHIGLITPDFLEMMIEETTPGDPLWTPCPSCRDMGKPVHPHGLWSWDVTLPQQLECTECGLVFPNQKYPEDIVLKTKWGKPQNIEFYGGEPFVIFGYKEGRPSFTANIRSRKVQWVTGFSRTLAEGFKLTGNWEYAATCRRILLRLARCYPNWLVHVGYGEYADMDPKIAALNINDLPIPELCPPPNEPDNRLWTGYWSAGRASGVGLESDFVRKVTAAYDLTCTANHPNGSPLYSEEEKLIIEKDLLLESTILLVCDKALNNKSVSNRTAAALVGMCVGHPGLLRFGLEGFRMTVDGWYLPDGTTSESPFYGLMTLGGIWDMAQAAQGYSDPPDFRDEEGKRIENLDLYRGTSYNLVWEAFFNGLQGDLFYPPYADSFRNTSLDVAYVELMVAQYPEKREYLALLKELCGKDLSLHSGSTQFHSAFQPSEVEPVLTLPYDLTKPTGSSSFSFYYRKPYLEKTLSQDLAIPNWCPESLRIGHLRTGNNGRESLLLLSASHWGNHHEFDNLHLYYWKNGREILSDLGYLWDHPKKSQNTRTLAHNTVLIDGQNQIGEGRQGKVLHFKSAESTRVMEMSSSAYPQANLYRRTSAIIDHGVGRDYVVDFFRVEGGETQDYVFHGTDSPYKLSGIHLEPIESGKSLYDFSNIKTGSGNQVWSVHWEVGPDLSCRAWALGQEKETVYVADGWGQRDWKNSDIGAMIPYFVRRCQGSGIKTFISVFEGFQGAKPFVKNVSIVDREGTIAIETENGMDYVMSMPETGILTLKTNGMTKKIKGHFTVGSIKNEHPTLWMNIPE